MTCDKQAYNVTCAKCMRQQMKLFASRYDELNNLASKRQFAIGEQWEIYMQKASAQQIFVLVVP